MGPDSCESVTDPEPFISGWIKNSSQIITRDGLFKIHIKYMN